jgi:ubiquinone/menaquinone biosynthesis C-methylase UbiE
MTAEITKQSQWQKLLGHILGNQAAWIANIGLKAGLFQAVADSDGTGISEEALAQKLNYNPRYVSVWCRGAYAFELLDWDKQSGYTLPPYLDALLLDSTDSQFLGGRIQFYTALHEDFNAFPNYLQTGGIWPRSAHDPFLLEALKNLSKPDVVMITDQVLPQAPEILERLGAGGTVLDIGSGGGHHIVHYARRFPQARVIGLEFDGPSIELARKTIAEAGLDGRVQIRQADANKLDDENMYDLVTMNIALHETGGPAEYRNVLKRVFQALKPGGAVVVSEIPYPDSASAYREEPVYKMFAGVQLHEALVGCGMITQGELRQLLEEGNFANVRTAGQPNPARFVMIGEKPGKK